MFYGSLSMIARLKSFFIASFFGLVSINSAHADAGLAVYGVVAATLGAGFGASIYGNGLANTAQSGIGKHQVSLMAGKDTDIDTARLAYRLEAKLPLWKTKDFALIGGLETSIGQWQADSKYPDRSLTDLGITPIFKLKRDEASPWYAEVGVGAHYLSNTRIKDYTKSTQFQFGDQLGLGWENHQVRLGYKYLHVSNGNIETPNPSTDFHMIELGYRY
jgi:hypothetical protein